MSLGEVIAKLCEHCATDDMLLMAKDVDMIECTTDTITVYFTDANTTTLVLPVPGREEEE